MSLVPKICSSIERQTSETSSMPEGIRGKCLYTITPNVEEYNIYITLGLSLILGEAKNSEISALIILICPADMVGMFGDGK